jgi:hypothetical protein
MDPSPRGATPAVPSSALHLPEPEARAVMWVRAFERDGTDAAWTAEDRAWATRLTRDEPATAALAPAQRLAARARHAVQRLRARDERCARSLEARPWRPLWAALALLAGLLTGVAVDHVGSGQRLNLMAPPVWALLVWNALVLVASVGGGLVGGVARLAGRPPRPLLRGLPRWLAGATLPAGRTRADAVFAAEWAVAAAPLWQARAALLLHLAAAGLALGVVLGLGARGLVLDYRAAWQSTFLEAPQVQAVLNTLLGPAQGLTGVAVPDVAPLRITAPDAEATGPAAPWIVLYATTLVAAVVLPRLLLAALAALRATRARRRIALPMDDGHFHHLLRQLDGGGVRVLLHRDAPPPDAALQAQVRHWLETAWGGTLAVEPAPAQAAPGEAPTAAAHLACVDLAATPEAEVHGQWLALLRQRHPGAPWALLADETALAARFAHLPERLAQRRRAWQDFADAQGVPLFGVDFQRGASPADGPALRGWLG